MDNERTSEYQIKRTDSAPQPVQANNIRIAQRGDPTALQSTTASQIPLAVTGTSNQPLPRKISPFAKQSNVQQSPQQSPVLQQQSTSRRRGNDSGSRSSAVDSTDVDDTTQQFNRMTTDSTRRPTTSQPMHYQPTTSSLQHQRDYTSNSTNNGSQNTANAGPIYGTRILKNSHPSIPSTRTTRGV